MGNNMLGDARDRFTTWVVVGLYHIRLGWLLGMGSSGKCRFYALDSNDSIHTFHYGSKKKRNVQNVEYGFNNSVFHYGATRYVY